MKIENQKVSDCRVRLVISAGADETAEDYGKVTRLYTQRARIPGFRPGKAPLEVIRRTYGRELAADAKAALISRLTQAAVEQEKLDVVARVSVENVVFAPETGISFVETFDIKPAVKVPKYQKIPVTVNPVVVDEAAVEKQVESIRASMSPREETEEPVAKDDMVQIDFEAASRGKPLAEAIPGAERFAKGTDFWALASSESEFVPGLSDAIAGKKKGEGFSFDTSFPKDFHFEPLRGVKARYSGTVKLVRRPKPITDEELAKNVGMESIDKVRETIRKHMADDAQAAEDSRVRNEIGEFLLRKSSFAVPESMVLAVMERKLEDVIRAEVAAAGAQDAKAYAKEHAAEIQKKARDIAERKVRLDYILDAIAAEQKIELTADEIQKEIDSAAQYYAMQSGDKTITPAKLRQNLEESGNIVLLKIDLLSAKVLKWLTDELKAAAK
jgi:trigger factor